MRRWGSLLEQIDLGQDLGRSATAAGCSAEEVARLTSPSSGAWGDLVDDVEGARVLLLDVSPARTAGRFAERGATVAVADDDPARAAVRARLLTSTFVPSISALGPLLAQRWDVVCIDGRPLRPDLIHAARAALAPGGRMVVVADNPWSPVRAVDRASGGLSGPVAFRLGHVRRLLEAEGLPAQRVFGLLRSSVVPACSFDVNAPRAASEVLAASTTRMSGHRLRAVELLARVVPGGRAASLLPAWTVIGSAEPSKAALPVVGRVGYEETTEAKMLYGEPPRQLEKWYESPAEADAEAMALVTLHEAGLDIAPRLVGRPADTACRMTWCEGRTLQVPSLPEEERRHWVTAAARALRQIHDATRRTDGSVLVHGDYWLGNMLVDGKNVSGVIDWASAGWGSPTTDLAWLVDSLVPLGTRPDSLADLRARCGRGYSDQPSPTKRSI